MSTKNILICIVSLVMFGVLRDMSVFLFHAPEITSQELSVYGFIADIFSVCLWYVCVPRFIYRWYKNKFTASVDESPMLDRPLIMTARTLQVPKSSSAGVIDCQFEDAEPRMLPEPLEYIGASSR